MPEVVVNNIAVIIAAIASMVLGAVWYGPLLGKVWMRAAGITKEDVEKDKKKMPVVYAITFVSSIVTAYVLAVFISWAQVTTLAFAIILSFLVWLGFVLTNALRPLIWEKRDQKLFLIGISNSFVSLLLMSAIIILIG